MGWNEFFGLSKQTRNIYNVNANKCFRMLELTQNVVMVIVSKNFSL